jgi:undecaprenyl-diphosphatase
MTDALIIFFASYLPYLLAIPALVFALLRRSNLRTVVLATITAGVARLTLKPFILLFVHRARPYGGEFDSFPSGHALFFFAFATVIYRHNKRWGWIFFIGATLMGIARVVGGIHWSTDVLGGAVLGILVGLLVDTLYARFCHKSQS